MFSLPRNVWLLTLLLALAMSAGAMMVMIGGVLGAALSPDASLSTLPVAMMVIGTASGVIPVTRTMAKVGRKPVFIGVSLLAASASLLAAYSVYLHSFWLFLIAAFILGNAVAGFQQIRFAAMESVDIALAPKAASTVLLGGLVAAMLGPELVTLGLKLISIDYTGSFLLMALLCLLCAMLFSQFQQPAVAEIAPTSSNQAIRNVLQNPRFVVAVSASVVGFGLMSFIMTATPVHMHTVEQHSLEHTKWVIQSHILAMYLPSLFSGWLIVKLGVKRIIGLGLLIYAFTIGSALSGNALFNYWVALVLLGIGWNFLFLAGTVLLSQTHTQGQTFKVQGMHDLMVFSAQAMASLGAGVMLYQFGWTGVMYISVCIIMLHVAILVRQSYRLKSARLINEVEK